MICCTRSTLDANVAMMILVFLCSANRLSKVFPTAVDGVVTELKTLIDTSFALEDTQKCAEAFHDQVLAKMEDIRTIASDIEALIPDSILSYPTYDQLLFSL